MARWRNGRKTPGDVEILDDSSFNVEAETIALKGYITSQRKMSHARRRRVN